MHAYGGGFYKSGITGQYFNERTGAGRSGAGNGTINSIIFQYDSPLASLIGPEVMGEQALDLSLFGMFNYINSQDDQGSAVDPGTTIPDGQARAGMNNVFRTKFGGDIVYAPIPWLALGFRVDHVRPHSKRSGQTFTVLGPRLIFRSNFATHEEIELGYTYYAYNQRVCENSQGAVDPNSLNCAQVPNGPVSPDGFGASAESQGAALRAGPREAYIRASDGTVQQYKDYIPPNEHVIRLSASMWW